MNLFFEIHKDLPREGPGDPLSTERAFQVIPDLPANPTVLDIGCGPGTQTVQLAKLSNGTVYAIDMHQPFLDQLQNQAEQHHVKKQIHPLKMSMMDLKFELASFDLIWSEGAIYIMGFQNGLESWKPFIKPGGYLAVSELCWLKDNPPQEVKAYWEDDYPGMKSNQENLKIIEQAGYTILDHFFLPENSWWDHYYKPIQERLNLLRSQYADQPEAIKMLDSSQREIDIFKNYFGWYSYAFYILKN